MTADEVRQVVEGLPTRSKQRRDVLPVDRGARPGRRRSQPAPARAAVGPHGRRSSPAPTTPAASGRRPAGIEAVVSGAVDLQHRLVDADQDLLNPIGLNCIRQFPGVGIVNWGARTLSSDPEWRYVPRPAHRRCSSKSRCGGACSGRCSSRTTTSCGTASGSTSTPSCSVCSARVRSRARRPTRPSSVKCDRETNPQELVDQGIVTAQVAFAPLKPAEFVVIEISQKSLLSGLMASTSRPCSRRRGATRSGRTSSGSGCCLRPRPIPSSRAVPGRAAPRLDPAAPTPSRRPATSPGSSGCRAST